MHSLRETTCGAGLWETGVWGGRSGRVSPSMKSVSVGCHLFALGVLRAINELVLGNFEECCAFMAWLPVLQLRRAAVAIRSGQ